MDFFFLYSLPSFMCSLHQNTNPPHPQGQPGVTFRAYSDLPHQVKLLRPGAPQVLRFHERGSSLCHLVLARLQDGEKAPENETKWLLRLF